ncbi:MAG: HEAT repeat domain-containing protein, partial [Planctomycetes bacterium]|nr:HEAT repeat domain-containing protein [Planctomycetota bacterium]
MKNTTWITSCLLSLGLFGLGCQAYGQDLAAGAADSPPAKPSEKAEPAPPAPTAAVRAIIDSDPTTAEELVVAAYQLTIHDQPQRAREMLVKVLAAKPDARTCFGIVQQHGAGLLLRLQGDRRVAPQGAQVAKLVLESADKAIRDPARLARLIQELKDPSAQQRRFAAADLAAAGMDALPLIVKSLSDPAQEKFHANFRTALVAFGDAAAAPMLGLIESSDPTLKAHAIAVLGRIKAPDTAIYLIGTLASRSEAKPVREAAYRSLQRMLDSPPRRPQAERMLKNRVTTMMGGNHRLPADHKNRVILWHFDERTKTLAPKTYHHDDAQAILAARLARDLHLAGPENVENRQLYLTATLKAAALVTGRDNPLATG